MIFKELEEMADPLRKEVAIVRKKIDIANRELKPLGQSCQKKVSNNFFFFKQTILAIWCQENLIRVLVGDRRKNTKKPWKPSMKRIKKKLSWLQHSWRWALNPINLSRNSFSFFIFWQPWYIVLFVIFLPDDDRKWKTEDEETGGAQQEHRIYTLRWLDLRQKKMLVCLYLV